MKALALFPFLTIATAGLLDECIWVEKYYRCNNVVPERYGEILHNLTKNDHHQCWEGCNTYSQEANISIFQRTIFAVLCVCSKYPQFLEQMAFKSYSGAITTIYSREFFS